MNTVNLNSIKRRDERMYHALLIVCISCMIYFILFPQTVSAEDAEITVLKQLSNMETDSISNFGTNAIRVIGFAVVKFLAWMGDSLFKGLQQMFDALTFTYSDELVSLVNRYSVLYKSFFLVAVVGLGFYLLAGKGKKELNTVTCIVVMILILSSMPLMMQKISRLTIASSTFVTEQWNKESNEEKVTSIAGTVLKESIVDLRKVDKNMTDTSLPSGLKKDQGYNSFNSNTWRSIDINAYMDYESSNYTLEHKSVWENKIVPSGEAGEYELEKIDGWTKLNSSYYYRYQVTSWFKIFMMLGCMAVLLFFLVIRAAKIVIDLAGAMIYTPFIAVTDLTTGQRIKEAIKDIIAHFAAMFILAAFMGIYFVAFTWITSSSLSMVAQLAMHVALVWAIIDGPNAIERIIGVDVGYSGVWKAALGAKAGADMAKGAGKFAATVAKGSKNPQTGERAGNPAARAGKAAASAVFGRKTVDDKLKAGADKSKEMLGDATSGKGMVGFAQNTVAGIKARSGSEHSSKALQNANMERMKNPRAAASASEPRSYTVKKGNTNRKRITKKKEN